MSLVQLVARSLAARHEVKPWNEPGYNAKDDDMNGYGYVPSIPLGIAFVVIFSLLTIGHLGQAYISRRAWLLTLVAGGLGEVVGWAGRVWSGYNVYNDNAFMMQIVCLVICPAFMSAAVYAIAGWIMSAIDPTLSLISPRLYWRIFVTADIFSLVVQSAGGGIAASAADGDKKATDLGSNIMLAGIVIQLVTTSIYAVFFVHFLLRVKRHALHPQGPIRYLVGGNLIATLAITVRGIYRVVELAQGWNGYLIQHEVYFWALDAIPMVICLFALNATHPHWTLRLEDVKSQHPLSPGSRKTHLPLDSTASGFPVMKERSSPAAGSAESV